MSYSAGRMPLFVDTTTPKAEYTNATFNSMTQPVVNQLCELFGMHIISELTEETVRGYRYYIGFDDEDPKLCIGWAVGNTNANYFYLLCVGMFYGSPLSTILDTVSSGTISDGQYYFKLIERNFSNTSLKYFFLNYISDTHFQGISSFYALTTINSTNSAGIYACIFESGDEKLMTWWYNSQYGTLDYTKDGLLVNICKTGTYFLSVKNYIGNSDLDYIIPYNLDHGVPVKDLYIYSRVLTAKKIYAINGEYYYCMMVGTNDGSYMIKINYEP